MECRELTVGIGKPSCTGLYPYRCAICKKTFEATTEHAYYLLDAFYHELDRIERDMEKRAKLVPGGWRDMRLMKSKLANLLLGLGGYLRT